MLRRLLAGAARRLGLRRLPRLSEGPGAGLVCEAGPSNPAYETGANERPVQDELVRGLHPDGVFIDVGANIGFFSILAARLVGPRGKVHAFEPVPDNVALIERNARRNRFENIAVHAVALADRRGTGRLVLAEYAGGAALDIAAPPPDACGTMTVAQETLDDWLAGRQGLVPDLVKIDVEGAEAAVLRGMQRTLADARPMVIVEIDDADRGTAEAKAGECRGLLEAAGYRVRRLPDSYPGIAWHVIHIVGEAG